MGKMNYISNLEEWKSDFSFYITVKVRFNETDMFGHMNNTVPYTYFEEARIEYLKSLGLMQKWISLNSECIPVVADSQCDYLQQVYFDETLKVYAKIESLGRSSIDLHYMGISPNGKICFTGRSSLVNLNKKTARSEEWNKEWKAIFQSEMKSEQFV